MKSLKEQKAFQGNCLIVSLLLCLLTAGIYAWVVFPQTGMIDTYSDTSLHVLYAKQFFSGEAPAKCYMYPITFACISILGRFAGSYFAGATVFVGICAFLTCFLQICVVQKMVSTLSGYQAAIYGFCLGFMWPIDLSGLLNRGVSNLYLKVGAASPVHNFTSLTVKPFAIVCFYLLVKIFDCARKENYQLTKKDIGSFFILGISLFFSVMAKPNFYQCFAPAGFLSALIYLYYLRKKIFMHCVALGLSFVPATCYVLYGMQHNLSPLRIMPLESYKLVNGDFPIFVGFVQAVLFIVLVTIYLLFFRRKNMVWVCWCIVIVGFLEFVLLAEPADLGSMNMQWGFMVSLYLAYIFSLCELENNKQKTRNGTILYGICKGCFFIHAFTGLYAFYEWGRMYYTLL